LDTAGADLAVLVPGDDPFLPELRIFRLLRDDELVERLADRLRQWWRRHVVGGEPPPLDDSPAAARLLAAAERGARTATAREVELARAYATAAAEEKAAKERKRAAGRELIRSAGLARQLEIPRGGRVSIVAGASRGELDEGALLHDRPELEPVLEHYRRPGSAFVYPRVAGLR
jgi:predicted phage-related endonuclease